MITKTHYLFPLTLSPWPFLSSFCSMNLFFSFMFLIKYDILLNFYMSLLLILIGSIYWSVSYSLEMNLKGFFSFDSDLGLKSSFIFFIFSEILFFFSLFWAYYHFYSVPFFEGGMLWPPKLVESVPPLSVPVLGTLNLLFSGVLVTISHNYLSSSSKLNSFGFWLMCTILLGANFLVLQLSEFNSSFFSIMDSAFGSSFFVLTGFHGIHVLIGVFFLVVVFYRSFLLGAPKGKNYLSFEMAAWYWHFVDVVWLFLFYSLYYLSY